MKERRLSETQLFVLLTLNHTEEYLCFDSKLSNKHYYFHLNGKRVSLSIINSLLSKYLIKTIFFPVTNLYKTVITDKGKKYLENDKFVKRMALK
jgi:hypothetical protein